MRVHEFLARLRSVTVAGEGQWRALCPGHEDTNASLSVKEVSGGTILLRCHAGCDAKKITGAVGLALKDLFAPKAAGEQHSPRLGELVKAYDYTDADGKLLYQVCRFNPKAFRQRRPDGDGWTWNLGDTPRVLYRLPDLLADPLVTAFVVEGEKDADNLKGISIVATCNAGGAGKWSTLSDDSALHGRRVCIIPDRDEPGRKHALDVAQRLHGKAAEVRVLNLPGNGKDATDWLDGQDSLEPDALKAALLDMAEKAPVWTLGMTIGASDAGDALGELRAELSAEAAGLRRPIPLSFAPRLAGLTRGTTPGSVMIVAGSPGSAKSFLALNMLVSAADAGFPASYIPLESDRAFHLRRLAAILDGSWAALSDPLKDPNATATAQAVVERHAERLSRLGGCILENPCKPTRSDDGKLAARRIDAHEALSLIEHRVETDKLIVLDPFTMIGFSGRDEWRGQDDFIGRLVGIAAESKAVIVVVVHLVKKPEPGRVLSLGDVQGGATLTRLSSAVVMLDKYERRDLDVWVDRESRTSVESNLTLVIGKSRSGEGAGLRLAYRFGDAGPRFAEHGIIAPRESRTAASEREHWANE